MTGVDGGGVPAGSRANGILDIEKPTATGAWAVCSGRNTRAVGDNAASAAVVCLSL